MKKQLEPTYGAQKKNTVITHILDRMKALQDDQLYRWLSCGLLRPATFWLHANFSEEHTASIVSPGEGGGNFLLNALTRPSFYTALQPKRQPSMHISLLTPQFLQLNTCFII
jgi:hypothetical protein